MPGRDIVVIGASAGGVEALKKVVGTLSPDLPASFFIVLHISPVQKSYLPEILTRAGPLPAVHAKSGEPIQQGRIYVARPDQHLLIQDGRIRLWRGPKENYSRPAIDPLFRSAAEAFGRRVIGVVLTGMLDDGTAGLVEIKKRGGISVVQDPDEAQFDSMPGNALKRDHVDYCVKLSAIPELLNALIRDSVTRHIPEAAMMQSKRYSPTELTCPECGGPLSVLEDEALVQFRCRVGHVYSLESAVAAHAEAQERTLWSAVVALEAGAELFRKAAAVSESAKASRLIAQAKTREADARSLRKILEDLSEEML
jgi:two-component system chemotaxis response regulator CheB